MCQVGTVMKEDAVSGNIKINPDIAEGVASNFGNKANDLSALISVLSNEVNANVGSGKPAWEGQQANDFEASWNNEFKPSLQKLVDALNGARDLLKKTIDAYRQLDS
jgi:WXG100 family type VII secretion target